jgi:hypothetical protein
MNNSRLNPIVDVGVLRARYMATLAMAVIAGFTVVETFAFGGGVRHAIAFALGIGIAGAGVAGLALSLTRRGEKQRVTASPKLRIPVWDVLAGLAAVIGGWQIVQTLVFSAATSRWLTFADGCALEALALAGLVLHELSTERVVHALEVVGSAIDSTEPDRREPEQMHATAS